MTPAESQSDVAVLSTAVVAQLGKATSTILLERREDEEGGPP